MDKIVNQLTFISYHHTNNNRKIYNLYQCECGNTKIIYNYSVNSNNTISCGCYKKDNPSITHNLSNTKEYNAWRNFKSRCYNSNNPKYKDYGGRGIIVCDEWINSFETFIKDVGKAPSKLHSIDRIENDGNYSKENCKWSTNKEQRTNQRNYKKYSKHKIKRITKPLQKLNING